MITLAFEQQLCSLENAMAKYRGSAIRAAYVNKTRSR